MLRINREFMEYMRVTYPNTPLSDFKVTDVYVQRTMEDLVIWRKMRKMKRRTGRSETRSGGLTQFIVYKD